MTLQQIHYALTIEECGSMNKASEKLFIVQPTLTNAMQELEHEVGFSIRETQTQKVLTDVGSLKSEVGILYMSTGNERMLRKLMAEQNVVFHPLVRSRAYVYLWGRHPLAHALADIPDIAVNYLTLPHHPYHAYVEKELNGYGGGILSFRAGSRENAFRIINTLKYAMIASNIGDVRTLVLHPASTIYRQAGKAEMEAAGVFEDTVRVSVGIEDGEDLIRDFTEAVIMK